MPNFQEQRVDQDGIYIRTPDDIEVTVTSAEILDHYDHESGTDLERRLNTRVWVKDVIEVTLGTGNVAAGQMDLDFDPATGIPYFFSTEQ